MTVSAKTARDNCGKVHAGAGYSEQCYKHSVVRKKSYPCKKKNKSVTHQQVVCCTENCRLLLIHNCTLPCPSNSEKDVEAQLCS